MNGYEYCQRPDCYAVRSLYFYGGRSSCSHVWEHLATRQMKYGYAADFACLHCGQERLESLLRETVACDHVWGAEYKDFPRIEYLDDWERRYPMVAIERLEKTWVKR